MIVVISAPANAATGSTSNGSDAAGFRQQPVADHDGGGGRKARAGRDAGQHRIGQRIAEQALHDGAAGREQRADHDGQRDARQPDRPQHQLIARDGRGIALREAERGGQAAERNAGGADGGGNRSCDDAAQRAARR